MWRKAGARLHGKDYERSVSKRCQGGRELDNAPVAPAALWGNSLLLAESSMIASDASAKSSCKHGFQ